MRFMNPGSLRISVTYSIVLGVVATAASMPWTVVAAEAPAADKVAQKEKIERGRFVSFKDGRLLILGKNLGESFTKKYGDRVHFNKFREDVPVYESIDGGEYELVAGTSSEILGKVREGTNITIHGEGDDNITLIQIGVPKKQ
jgi:hypothetical protein